jgi:anti-sigma factor RsiW
MNTICNEDVRISLYLSLYHDGELDSEQARQLQAHLEVCGACAAKLRQLRTVTEGFARLPIGEITSLEQARIHRAVRNAALGVGERAILQLGYALAALAACMLVISSLCLADNTSLKARKPQAADWQMGVASMKSSMESSMESSMGADMRLSAFMVRGLGEAESAGENIGENRP